MSQSRRGSIVEAVVNTCVGLVVAFIMNVVLYSAYHVPVSRSTTFAITMWMTVVSIIRGYVLRRAFNAEWWKLVFSVVLVYAARTRKSRR